MALSDIAIRNAKASNKVFKLYDEQGLFIQVTPSGGKWWRLKFRFGGKEKLLSLGVYPDVSLKQARDRRDDARKLLAEGVDPSEHRKASKASKKDSAANSLEVISREWAESFFLNKSASHKVRTIRRLESYI